jgi:hypothetical protein
MIAKQQHNIRELASQRDHQGAEDEQQLDPQWANAEQQIEGLLRVSRRIVDKVYVKGYSTTKPQLVASVMHALLAKVQIDILDEAARGIIQQLDQLAPGNS